MKDEDNFGWMARRKADIQLEQADPEKNWVSLVVGPPENSPEDALKSPKELIEDKIKGTD